MISGCMKKSLKARTRMRDKGPATGARAGDTTYVICDMSYDICNTPSQT